jgi:1,4-dihydroxy-2-naphthoate octaprenyltransferase
MPARAKHLRALVALSRPLFHSVGVLPFVLGAVLAWRLEAVFNWQIFAVGTVGVVLVMLATYYAGEYWDFKEDALSIQFGTNRFAGGSRVLQKGLLSPSVAFWASIASVFAALGVGLVLQFGYHTGPWTLPLGMLGLAGGFFYSTRPIRWVSRGWGELWIAACYGWLPVAVGYYLQTGTAAPIVSFVAMPIGLTIFNVILINEFPDYPADLEAQKTNLTVRLGLERAATLYSLVNVGSVLATLLSLGQGVPLHTVWFYLPTMLLSLALASLLKRGKWKDPLGLERLCALTLIVNLGTTAAYILASVG